jgi:predicted enzyme related to lactoylglutathione lyase
MLQSPSFGGVGEVIESTMNSNESLKKNWTGWFEIPVTDMERARKFYENIFDTKIDILDLGVLKMAIFPHREIGCALCMNNNYMPSKDGVLVYLNASPDLDIVLQKIEDAGGKVLLDKRQISPDRGFMALFIDSEGNRLALHSMQ